jgi:hypothetical protein
MNLYNLLINEKIYDNELKNLIYKVFNINFNNSIFLLKQNNLKILNLLTNY